MNSKYRDLLVRLVFTVSVVSRPDLFKGSWKKREIKNRLKHWWINSNSWKDKPPKSCCWNVFLNLQSGGTSKSAVHCLCMPGKSSFWRTHPASVCIRTQILHFLILKRVRCLFQWLLSVECSISQHDRVWRAQCSTCELCHKLTIFIQRWTICNLWV